MNQHPQKKMHAFASVASVMQPNMLCTGVAFLKMKVLPLVQIVMYELTTLSSSSHRASAIFNILDTNSPRGQK